MNILYIGGGFVGACSAAVSADSGHNVLVYDIDKNKVEKLGSQDKAQIESCIFEDGLSDLLIRNHERIRFTTDYDDVVSFVEIASTIFMCLPTPEIGETGESDLSFYNDALAKLINIFLKRNGEAQSSYILLVNKSTVPVELIDAAQEMMDVAGVNNVSVVSNPEFLVEGKAIENSIHPDRVVVGALKQQDFDIMRELYQRFYTSSSVSYLEVNPKEAAAGKLLSNYYMFHKLMACFDVAGRTAEAFSDISFESLRTIITTDKRVNPWGLYDSLYAGGSCLIKDARSLSFQLQKQGKSTELIDEVYKANKRQLRLFLERAEAEAMYDFTGKTVAVLGLSFKQDTNDVRNSPAFDILSFLQDKGVSAIKLYDPVSVPAFSRIHPSSDVISYAPNEKEAIDGADVIIIATDWSSFRVVGDLVLSSNTTPLIMDGRRLLQHKYTALEEAGCMVIAVGSPLYKK